MRCGHKLQNAGYDFVRAVSTMTFSPWTMVIYLCSWTVLRISPTPPRVSGDYHSQGRRRGRFGSELESRFGRGTLSTIVDVNRHLEGLPDWTHSNALAYLPTTATCFISMRHQSGF